MVEQRLPAIDGDEGQWGIILNQYLGKEHYDTGSDNAANGGHKTITVRAGTTAAGTAPLKFTSGSLLTAPEAGAVEFLTDTLYFTQTTTTTRKKVATYDDSSGATGDIYYRDSSGYFRRLAIGSANDVLTVSGGLPAWSDEPRHTPTAVWGDNVNTASVVTGTVSYVRVPYSGTITSWHVVANTAITCTLDVWKANGTVPTNANTITASAKPSLSSSATAASSTLTGWTTSVSAGDVFGFELEALTGSSTSISLILNIH